MALGWIKGLLASGKASTAQDDTKGKAAAPPTTDTARTHVAAQPAPEPATSPSAPSPAPPPATVSPSASSIQRTPTVVTSDTVVKLPWLAAFDAHTASFGIAPHTGTIKVSAGSNVFVDAQRKQARIQDPEGFTRSWDNESRLTIRPSETSWQMVWLVLDGDDPQIQITPAEEDCDDEIVNATGYEFYCDGLEGTEQVRFPQMVRLLKDPFFNPLGFSLVSGIYKQAAITECFELNFGDDGSIPSMKLMEETAPASLDFPYRTEINVVEPLVLEDTSIEAGYYRTEVTGFNVYTGEVTSIKCHHLGKSFRLNSTQMTELIHQGKIEILSILQDERPNF